MKEITRRELADALLRMASPDIGSKAMMKMVRQQYPRASKKDVVLAAFEAIILYADTEPSKAKDLQNFALNERSGDDQVESENT